MKIPSERQIERRLSDSVKKVGGWALKLPAVYSIGIPDRLVLMPGGVAIFVELKAPNKKPRKSQIFLHKKLKRLGFRVEVLDSYKGVDDFIQTLNINNG